MSNISRENLQHAVLLIEGNEDDESLMRRACRSCDDVIVNVARDGEEALSILDGMPEEQLPQVITLDLNLPHMGGLQALRALRRLERISLIPIVVLSAASSEKQIMECYRHGASSFVKKPTDYDSFREAIKAILDYWIHRNYLPASC